MLTVQRTHGRTGVVTGASVGMGRAMTEEVLGKGDIAVATLRKPEVLADLVEKYRETGRLLVVRLDVTQEQEIKDACEKAQEAYGKIDVVYNAGYGGVAEVEGTPLDVARGFFEVNFWGSANVAREAVRFFRDVNKPIGGTLITVSSMAAFEPGPALGYYGASKFALNGVIETLARELKPDWNIKIVLLELGGFQTRGTKESLVRLPAHPAYDDPSLISYKVRAYLSSDPKLKGDAHKAVKQIYKIGQLENPPLHFPLGKDALAACERKSNVYAKAAQEYASWSEDLQFD